MIASFGRLQTIFAEIGKVASRSQAIVLAGHSIRTLSKAVAAVATGLADMHLGRALRAALVPRGEHERVTRGRGWLRRLFGGLDPCHSRGVGPLGGALGMNTAARERHRAADRTDAARPRRLIDQRSRPFVLHQRHPQEHRRRFSSRNDSGVPERREQRPPAGNNPPAALSRRLRNAPLNSRDPGFHDNTARNQRPRGAASLPQHAFKIHVQTGQSGDPDAPT